MGRAWLSAALGAVALGELAWQRAQDKERVLLGFPVSVVALLVLTAASVLLLTVGVAWLGIGYLMPGRLRLDPRGGTLTRLRRPTLRSPRKISAPLGQWHVHVTYFSSREQEERRFKRLQLACGGHREVLLFTDVRRAEALMRALEAARPKLGSFRVDREREV